LNQPQPNVSSENKIIAKSALSVFGGKPTVTKFRDESATAQVDILSCKDSPATGVTAFSTVNLSDTQFKVTADGLPLGVEIIGVCDSGYEKFARVISTAAFCVIKDRQECVPGAIFENAVSINDSAAEMKHLVLVPPFLWGEQPETIYFESKAVAWLLAVPISAAELNYARDRSIGDLEDLFDEKKIDIYNINRDSAA